MTRLAAIVVTYNRLDQLTRTVERLLAAPEAHLARLLVVDNASTDGTAAWLAAQADPRLEVLRLEVNGGGAGGFEAGMRHLRDGMDPDWYLLMDDDGRPAPGALAAFHGNDRSSREGWAAAVTYPSGAICEMNRPWVNPFWHGRAFLTALTKGRAGYHLSDAAYEADTPTPIDGTSFVGLFLSRDAVEKAGLPDPRLFLYGDDVLYTLSLTALGGRIAFDPALRFEHDTLPFSPGTEPLRPLWKVYYYQRNLLLAYRKAAGPLFFRPLLLMVLPRWRRAAALYGADAEAYARVSARAVRDGLARRRDLTHAEVMALAEG
ncbi:glycosyltransferase [Pelagovum pacificum]|uniref:Glycosyltransferase n=1 Tax=Pelagovum pacificum TaxID=2588711 RepID=A0A5C5G771_9RHOB|nr:glycosyltransferase [Pelagovum pacificum]QQA45077.1 glycosyltransferase [Pelagovum pacificum]TNY30549.1 glycosyltransferase [Pelagovum pacificum]